MPPAPSSSAAAWSTAVRRVRAAGLQSIPVVTLLARRMTALTQRVGQAPPQSASLTERLLEAEGI